MQLSDALEQVAEIQAQIARTATFRGYRAATVACSGGIAIATGLAQWILVRDPREQASAYLGLWITAAAIGVALTACELVVRCRRQASPRLNRMTFFAVEQFLPCVLAGALLTAALLRNSPESLWMLPGMWAVLFSLGIFASYRLLPRAVFWVGAFYLFAGTALLAQGPAGHALSPWAMAGTFGIGQFAGAAILYVSLERRP